MATRSLTLRTGSARDVAAVDAIMAAAFDPRFGEAWTRNQCLGVLAMPGVRLTIAETDAGPAGFSLVRAVADEAELLLIAVVPAARREGIGAALLRTVAVDAGAMGATALHLEVRAGNPATRLYLAHGFRKVGERRGYYRSSGGQLIDAHTYRRDLGSVASR